MKIRHTEVYDSKTKSSWTEFTEISLKEHIARKLNHVGCVMNGEEFALGLNAHDKWKYSNNKAVLSSEKIKSIDRLKTIQIKHADIKKLIKSTEVHIDVDEEKGHEILDEISWTDFKQKFMVFFSKEY